MVKANGTREQHNAESAVPILPDDVMRLIMQHISEPRVPAYASIMERGEAAAVHRFRWASPHFPRLLWRALDEF